MKALSNTMVLPSNTVHGIDYAIASMTGNSGMILLLVKVKVLYLHLPRPNERIGHSRIIVASGIGHSDIYGLQVTFIVDSCPTFLWL